MIRRLHIFVFVFFSIIGYSQQITGIVIEAGSDYQFLAPLFY